MLRNELESINERLDRVEGREQREGTPQGPRRERGRARLLEDDLYKPSEVESDQASNQSERRWGQTNRGPRQRDQNLTQENRSVEDYFKEIEIAMIRADVEEDREATIARFLAGLNRDITNVVELQHYVEVVDMVHVAIKGEKQLKRKSSSRTFPSTKNSQRWNQGTGKKDFSNYAKDQPLSTKANKPIGETSKGKEVALSNRSREIKWFKCLGRGRIAGQCPNRSNMILWANGEIKSEEENDEEPDETAEEEGELEYAVDGEILVIKRSLGLQSVENEQQRENIFHARCHAQGKVCSLIVDGGSCTNVASTLMVEKLGLPTTKHPQPDKLQWLNDGGELKVTKQVLVHFSIGKYHDEVLCDVVPMHAGHMLLGRPWQFDRKVIHDGFTNRYTFKFDGKIVTLVPMTTRQESKDIFPEDIPSGLPPIRGIEHQIDFIPGASIPNCPAYRTNPEETKKLQKQVNELMEKGYIRESLSPCAVPVLLVPKKDGTWRMYVDCHAVNKITIKYRHPIPRLDDMIDELSGAQLFSKIDLKSGFVVSSEGLEVDQDKVKAIREWPRPTSISQVRSFHGLASFYQGFIPNFSTLAAPLTSVLKKSSAFFWNEEQEKSFIAIKSCLTNALPDFTKMFEVEFDASSVEIGAVLTQDGRPVAYFSEKLNGVALNYPTYDKEMYALIRAFETWQHYLWPKEFVIHSDHEALKHIKGQAKLNKRHAKWEMYVDDADFGAIYKSCENKAVDKYFRFDGFLFREGKLCVPRSSIQKLLVIEAYGGGLMGHFGVAKTLSTLHEHFF
ncbi:uncharacterized protein LOC128034767 [Gossypium raimondii]|uniref:uncharacterized protein LOC128034767 n=1 Tax=Gossypium raimondii TaxID=29730 RepID=UPI00227BDDAA|nr:uncharacterized protein LOC128034767 [Gossypium raimondii]